MFNYHHIYSTFLCPFFANRSRRIYLFIYSVISMPVGPSAHKFDIFDPRLRATRWSSARPWPSARPTSGTAHARSWYPCRSSLGRCCSASLLVPSALRANRLRRRRRRVPHHAAPALRKPPNCSRLSSSVVAVLTTHARKPAAPIFMSMPSSHFLTYLLAA
jgi:hypothetical protein